VTRKSERQVSEIRNIKFLLARRRCKSMEELFELIVIIYMCIFLIPVRKYGNRNWENRMSKE